MAKTQISRKGFGQVEPNHLSAQTNGQIYAQLPASTVFNILENGMFLKYDYPNKECNLTGKGEWMLVMNEIKLYDQRAQALKDYAMQKSDFMGGELVPRLLRTEIGDIYTTNTFGANTSPASTVSGASLDVGDLLKVDESTGYLTPATTADTGMIWQVAKVYTMPDMQPGVKIQRIS
jgi:hypothetical protein